MRVLWFYARIYTNACLSICTLTYEYDEAGPSPSTTSLRSWIGLMRIGADVSIRVCMLVRVRMYVCVCVCFSVCFGLANNK